MVENRTYAEIVLIIALLASLGVNITHEDTADNIFSCDVETVPNMYCFKLSKVNDAGIQRNCYYNKESPRKYKVCSTGWEKITLEEALGEIQPDKPIPSKNFYQEVCSVKECVPI